MLESRQNSGSLFYRQDLTILSNTPWFRIQHGMASALLTGKRDKGDDTLALTAPAPVWISRLLALSRPCHTCSCGSLFFSDNLNTFYVSDATSVLSPLHECYASNDGCGSKRGDVGTGLRRRRAPVRN